jgi:5-methylcytosine-specific restriction protein A
MKLELVFLLGGLFFVADAYQDNKYTKALASYQKHAKTAVFLFMAGSLYLFLKRNPHESAQLMTHLNGMIKYMPIDNASKDFITPFFKEAPVDPRVLKSGGSTVPGEATGRSVSSTKKKYVAAAQSWKCSHCNKQLDAWFEVDHVVRLADGGSNHISNLVALCRNCHGQKTTMENM